MANRAVNSFCSVAVRVFHSGPRASAAAPWKSKAVLNSARTAGMSSLGRAAVAGSLMIWLAWA